MVSEDFLCEDCGFRAIKGGSCPRCDAEMTNLKESDQSLNDDDDEDEVGSGNFSFDDDFDFSDEAMMI